MRSCQFEKGKFVTILEAERNDLVQDDPQNKVYHVRFPEFLEVIDPNNRNISEVDQPNFAGGQRSGGFGTSDKRETVQFDYATSYFFNRSTSMMLNEWAQIINSEEVLIYGYWANNFLSRSLPIDYQE